jgi:hypothetical protein
LRENHLLGVPERLGVEEGFEIVSDAEGALAYSVAAAGVCALIGGGFGCGVAYAIGYYALYDVFRDAAQSGGCVQITSTLTLDVEPVSNEYCEA